ncbi:sensor of ECF-type sigma factor [Flavobacterium muglaense]|uniref:Sensor of ECF-type sigma factor n=1 Tax=Flavobacterium muglaense TaxID=2764716 RepID=A0A923N195_9FLAO|nr:sensor of ECF-type sigma factor [Flavobacterium muglaense]MBC5839572.1 sensor of ECF-type sigma factor [Flavobacterium muglaense]MBC5846108.1 sensor of ECF-type sigma factor [Flavobacterium muglaense]
MNFKKLLPILFLFTTFSFFAQGENMKEKKEKIKALKVAFLTTELDLTAREAQKFWPVYNSYDDDQFEIRHQKMKAYINQMNDAALDKISERDALNLLNKIEDTDQELYLLRKKFSKDLQEILPAVKILKLKKSEEDFNRKLLHQYRDRANKK